MKKILKLNNVPIWNLTDMQREFSPLAAYAVLQDFCDFAQVHCVPLPTCLETKAAEKIERYQAQYLKKEFWLNIPTRCNWPSATSAMDCIQHFAKECYNAATGGHESTGFHPAQGTTISQQMEKNGRIPSSTENCSTSVIPENLAITRRIFARQSPCLPSVRSLK